MTYTGLPGAPSPLPESKGAALEVGLGNLLLPGNRALRDVGLADLKRTLRAAGVPFPADAGHAAIAQAYAAFVDNLRREAADTAERAWKQHVRGGFKIAGFNDGCGGE